MINKNRNLKIILILFLSVINYQAMANDDDNSKGDPTSWSSCWEDAQSNVIGESGNPSNAFRNDTLGAIGSIFLLIPFSIDLLVSSVVFAPTQATCYFCWRNTKKLCRNASRRIFRHPLKEE